MHADLHVEAGHLPAGTRTRLVNAVLDQPAAAPGAQLDVTLLAGDAEILHRLRERCDDVDTRAAGASMRAPPAPSPTTAEPPTPAVGPSLPPGFPCQEKSRTAIRDSKELRVRV